MMWIESMKITEKCTENNKQASGILQSIYDFNMLWKSLIFFCYTKRTEKDKEKNKINPNIRIIATNIFERCNMIQVTEQIINISILILLFLFIFFFIKFSFSSLWKCVSIGNGIKSYFYLNSISFLPRFFPAMI